MKKQFRKLLLGFGAIVLALGGVFATAAPAQASAPVVLSGSSWFSGTGVNVCSASTDPNCGSQSHVGGWSANWWQCVELAQRFYQSKGWHSGIFSGVNYAYQIYDNATSLGMSRQANGSITSIVPGDMIIHASNDPASGGAGHVAIVDSVVGLTVNVVEQNGPTSNARATYSRSGGTLTRGSAPILGIVHSPSNTTSTTPTGGKSLSGDTKADLLWYEASNNGTGKVNVTNPAGNGGVSFNSWFSGYSSPDWSGLGDFNGDGYTDLAWYEAWNNGGTLKVNFSNGTGFTSQATWFSGYSAPTKAYVADFSGDGKADIGWYEAWNNGGTMKVIQTNSTGTGSGPSYTWFSGFSAPDWTTAADFTGDNKADIAWYEGWNNGTMKIFSTNSSGTGTGAGYTWFSGYGAPDFAGAGDFTGDGKADLAWYEAWNNGGTLKVFATNSSGNGMGAGYTWFSNFAAPTYAGIADFTGDNKSDILWYSASNNGTGHVVTTNSSGTGSSGGYNWFSGYAAPTWAAVG